MGVEAPRKNSDSGLIQGSIDENSTEVREKINALFKSILCKNFYPIFGDAALYNVDCFLSELKNDNESKVEISALSGESIDDSDSVDRELTYSSSDFGSLKCKIHFANGCCTRYLETVIFDIESRSPDEQVKILDEFKNFLEEAVNNRNTPHDEKNE